jgi:hypothetical protein
MRNIRGRIIVIAIAFALMAAFIVAYISFISADSSGEIILPPDSSESQATVATGVVPGFQGMTKIMFSRSSQSCRAQKVIINR